MKKISINKIKFGSILKKLLNNFKILEVIFHQSKALLLCLIQLLKVNYYIKDK